MLHCQPSESQCQFSLLKNKCSQQYPEVNLEVGTQKLVVPSRQQKQSQPSVLTSLYGAAQFCIDHFKGLYPLGEHGPGGSYDSRLQEIKGATCLLHFPHQSLA